MINLENVFLTRSSKNLFNGISLKISEKRVGIIGNNGSGKTSFARLLSGLLKADSGRIIVDDVDVSTDSNLLPSIIGFIFQNPDHQIIFPTVGEELSFGLLQAEEPRELVENKVKGILFEYGCEDWYNSSIQQLSEGQKQLICILALLVMEPKIIIFDEALISLDIPTRRSILRLIDTLEQQIIMISHDLDSLRLFDRLIWLHEGQIKMDATPSLVIEEYSNFFSADGPNRQ